MGECGRDAALPFLIPKTPAAMLDQAPILVLNHLLKDADWARQRLQPFAGRRARIVAPPLNLALGVDDQGYFVADGGEPDVSISLPAGAPLLALQGKEALLREVRISGPADFADALGFVLKNLRWDAEEDLSKLVGDIAAHRLMDFGRRFVQWQRTAAVNAADNLVEYVRDEKSLLPHRDEVGQFAADLARLQDKLAKLEQGLLRLGR